MLISAKYIAWLCSIGSTVLNFLCILFIDECYESLALLFLYTRWKKCILICAIILINY